MKPPAPVTRIRVADFICCAPCGELGMRIKTVIGARSWREMRAKLRGRLLKELVADECWKVPVDLRYGLVRKPSVRGASTGTPARSDRVPGTAVEDSFRVRQIDAAHALVAPGAACATASGAERRRIPNRRVLLSPLQLLQPDLEWLAIALVAQLRARIQVQAILETTWSIVPSRKSRLVAEIALPSAS